MQHIQNKRTYMIVEEAFFLSAFRVRINGGGAKEKISNYVATALHSTISLVNGRMLFVCACVLRYRVLLTITLMSSALQKK